MEFYRKEISDVLVFKNIIHKDERGFFYEGFVKKIFDNAVGRDISFVQDNYSSSKMGVLRGMHYQERPFEQGKLVSVIHGEIFDVALDIRTESKTFGSWTSEYLSDVNNKQMWIPEGFAHGFLAITDNVLVNYKTTNYYSKDHERIIKYNDSNFKISWPQGIELIISEKDLLDE